MYSALGQISFRKVWNIMARNTYDLELLKNKQTKNQFFTESWGI